MDRIDENKTSVRRFFRELDRHNFAVIAEVIADDFVDYAASNGAPGGREGVAWFYRALYGAFPDLKMSIHDVIAECDKVVVRKTATGTHYGQPFMGYAATGRKLELDIINIFQFNEEGRIAKHWHAMDSAAVQRQLGPK